jgi:hypothetical protein
MDVNNPWIIDEYPYHLDADIWSQIDHESSIYANSVFKDIINLHSGSGSQDYYNIVKFYKMNFFLFPRMQQYDYVVWLDGTIEVHSDTAALTISTKLQDISTKGFHVMLFEHTRSTLEYEAMASATDKRWAPPPPPSQSEASMHTHEQYSYDKNKNNVLHQLQTYSELGYSEAKWRAIDSARPLYGLWVTCFIAYDMREPSTQLFLQSWFTHTQLFSSQCQLSFSFLCQMNRIADRAGVPFRPYSLPDGDIRGTNRVNSLFRKKRYHGSATI